MGKLRLLVVLETISLLCFPQVATLTHGVFFLIPLAALFLAAAIRLHSRPRILLAEPICVLWPDNHSRHGLAREQAPNLRFGGFVWVLKLVCSFTFWTSPAAFSFLGDGCPDAVPRPGCSHYRTENFVTPRCAEIQTLLEPSSAKREKLYASEGDPCWDQCSSCAPESLRHSGFPVLMHYCRDLCDIAANVCTANFHPQCLLG